MKDLKLQILKHDPWLIHCAPSPPDYVRTCNFMLEKEPIRPTKYIKDGNAKMELLLEVKIKCYSDLWFITNEDRFCVINNDEFPMSRSGDRFGTNNPSPPLPPCAFLETSLCLLFSVTLFFSFELQTTIRFSNSFVCPWELINIWSLLLHSVPSSIFQDHHGVLRVLLQPHLFYFQMKELFLSILAPVKVKENTRLRDQMQAKEMCWAFFGNECDV